MQGAEPDDLGPACAPGRIVYTVRINAQKAIESARDVLDEMGAVGVTPNEVTISTSIKRCESFEAALSFSDWALEQGYFVGRGAYQAVNAFPIAHIPSIALLAEYHARTYKFDTALESPMNQYRKTGQPEQARHLPMLLSSVKVDLREPAKGPLMRWIVLVLALWPLPAPADETGDALAFVLEHSGYEDIVLVRLPGGLFATEVRVNGQRGLFMIDSGASQTVLDADRARLYPLGPVLGRQEVTGALGTLAVQRRQVQVLGIGALSETRTLIHVADLSHITRAIAAQGGPVVDGVIGQDLLLHHSAVLDMARGRMFLRDGAE